MKKILFSLLLVAAMSANAQTFDEVDLIGTWRTPGLTYAPLEITNIESIALGDHINLTYGSRPRSGFIINYTREGDEYPETERILDYFITNNNKLHIIVQDDYTLHFIIEELTSSSLKVKTYDGHRFTFVKVNSSSSVKPMTQTHSADDSIYNLSGQKVEDVTTNGVYIQNGQKKVVKK